MLVNPRNLGLRSAWCNISAWEILGDAAKVLISYASNTYFIVFASSKKSSSCIVPSCIIFTATCVWFLHVALYTAWNLIKVQLKFSNTRIFPFNLKTTIRLHCWIKCYGLKDWNSDYLFGNLATGITKDLSEPGSHWMESCKNGSFKQIFLKSPVLLLI